MLKDLLTSLLLLAVAATYFALTGQINESALADEFGAAGLPAIYAWLLGFLGLLLLAKTLIGLTGARRPAATTSSDDVGSAPKLMRAAGMLGIGIAYLLIVPYLGYLLALILIIAVAASYQGEPFGIRLALISVGGGLAFFAFFVMLLGIDMPPGIW